MKFLILSCKACCCSVIDARSSIAVLSYTDLCLSQRSDDNQFLFEATLDSSVQSTVDALVDVHNLRQRIHRLKVEGEELAKYGPSKQPDEQGIDTYSEENVEKGEHYNMDPTGRRTGNGTILCLLCVLHWIMFVIFHVSREGNNIKCGRNICLLFY